MLREAIKKILGEVNLGIIDYYRFPKRANAWGGPFNGQEVRKEIFVDIMRQTRPEAIIETGSYLGTTTEYFAETGLPVFTIEGVARIYGYAKARLRKHKNVKLYNGDSRDELKELFKCKFKKKQSRSLFIYLDAHWYEDLPLKSEIEIIYENHTSSVVMVDDFQVPDDSGYTYDDYENGNVLNMKYLAEIIDKYDLSVYFPAKLSGQETGMKRGSVVICKSDSEISNKLSAVHSLRSFVVK